MRNQNPKTLIMGIAENHVPLMRYQNENNFSSWQKKTREKLCELLGLANIGDCEDSFLIGTTEEFEDYTDTQFSFQSEAGLFVPCHFLKPKIISGKLPVVICLQGHSTGMHISIGKPIFDGDEDDINSGDRDYARRAVKQGFCAVAVEQRYMGFLGGTENGPGCIRRPENSINALPALLFGRTAIGERVHDVKKAIDVITNPEYEIFSCIDKDNIILTGNSGGGTTTFYTACADERIKYAIPSCSVCTYKDSIIDLSHCACNYIPSAALYFDMCDLAGLIAPRGLIIVAGKEDKIFPIDGVLKTYDFAKKLYACADAQNKIDIVIGEGGHRYYADGAFGVLEKMMSENSD